MIVNEGVYKTAEKLGVKPQTIYQQVYYRMGLTVKQLKRLPDTPSPSSPECDSEQPSSQESLPPAQGDK